MKLRRFHEIILTEIFALQLLKLWIFSNLVQVLHHCRHFVLFGPVSLGSSEVAELGCPFKNLPPNTHSRTYCSPADKMIV